MTPILLGHNDALLHMHRNDDHLCFLYPGADGHLDLPRARAAGVAGGFFACWVPRYLHEADPDQQVWPHEFGYEMTLAGALDPDHAYQHTLAMMERLYLLEADSGGAVKVVRSLTDLMESLEEGSLAAILHFEGAEAIHPDLSNLEELRSLGPVWSRSNAFGHGVPFCFPSGPDTGPGLTAEGKYLVRACNELGILVDVSHLNEQGFWDVARISEAPLVASHSNAHSLCPSSRNLTDEQLQAIAQSHGLVGVNFCTSDLRPDGLDEADTSIELIYQQFDYLVERIGVEHVAFGSDFDGCIIPAELGDVLGLTELVSGLEARGYSQTDLEQMALGNWLRVLADSW